MSCVSFKLWRSLLLVIALALTACSSQAIASPTPIPTNPPQLANVTTAIGSLTCSPPQRPGPNEPLAARVNGIGIPLDLYNREIAQAQVALVQQRIDPKSPSGRDRLKDLQHQILDQIINDAIIAQQAEKEGVKLAEDELNSQLVQAVQDAGGLDKFNDYLLSNQISVADLCLHLRANYLSEAMLNRVTSALPSNVDQVHARHILLPTAALAQTVLAQIRQGGDFAALAQQYSADEATKSNGGDLGWFPRGVMELQFEVAAFQLMPGQSSDIVQTRFGYHIIKVEERDSTRALSPEILSNMREQAFLAWLQALREAAKIERLVAP
jgi:parvulin-like peptidyl-prolyl isomerase